MRPSAKEPHHQTWRFGAIEFDPQLRELRKRGIRIKLQEQPARVLAALLETPGEVVSRDELQRRLWPDGTFVDFQHSLNKAVNKLRQVLPDSADHPIYIETLPRLGYRFLIPVEKIEPSASGPHYRILGEAGRGAMGVVYKAEDLRLRRRVALKFVPPGLADDALTLERFRREAQALAALSNAGICTLYGLDEHKGRPCIVMEYVEGRPLSRLIEGRPLTMGPALDFAVQMSGALAAAHHAGVVHRDLKPANIIVSDDGRVKILDFGLAKLMHRGDTDEASETTGPQTEEGVIVGTAGYMSPEQAAGNPADARSDIFSFGSVLYEMITGRRAFERNSKLSTVAAILREEPAPVRSLKPDVPAGLERIIDRCLRKAPADRFQSMEEVRAALEQVKNEPGSGALAPAVPPRRRTLAWATSVLLLVAAGLGGWFGLFRPPTAGIRATVSVFAALPGSQWGPAFSPDGKQVAFVWNGEKQDNYDIYVQLVGDATRQRLTSSPALEYSPVWSPDSLHIAFLRNTPAGTEVLIIPARGGAEQRLHVTNADCVFPYSPAVDRQLCGIAWSPDGSLFTIVDKDSPRERNSIFVLDHETREKHRLTSPPSGYRDGISVFSPDGRRLAFARCQPALCDIYVLPLSASGQPRGEPHRITYDNAIMLGLDWSADGRSLVFSSERGGLFALWRVAASGGEPERLLGAGNNSLWPSVSRKGDQLAYTEGVSDYNIWRVRAPDGNADAAGAVPMRVTQSPQMDEHPTFSPDGSRIAWASMHSGTHQVWVARNDGSDPRPLTDFRPPGAGNPRWSPDGRQIAFLGHSNGLPRLCVIAADGGKPRQLTTVDLVRGLGSGSFTWSHDSNWVYFVAGRGEEGSVWKVSAGGGTPTQLAPKGYWPVESVDEKFVYYSGPEASIWKVPAAGGSPVVMARKGWAPVFESSDGKFIYYGGPDATIWKAPVSGGEAMQVVKTRERASWRWAISAAGIHVLDPDAKGGPALEFFPSASMRKAVLRLPGEADNYAEGIGMPSVSPDGRWILYPRRDQKEFQIMLVNHFR